MTLYVVLLASIFMFHSCTVYPAANNQTAKIKASCLELSRKDLLYLTLENERKVIHSDSKLHLGAITQLFKNHKKASSKEEKKELLQRFTKQMNEPNSDSHGTWALLLSSLYLENPSSDASNDHWNNLLNTKSWLLIALSKMHSLGASPALKAKMLHLYATQLNRYHCYQYINKKYELNYWEKPELYKETFDRLDEKETQYLISKFTFPLPKPPLKYAKLAEIAFPRKKPISYLEFSPQNNYLLCESNTLDSHVLWTVEKEPAQVQQFRAPRAWNIQVTFNPNDTHIAIAKGNRIDLYTLPDYQRIISYENSIAIINSLILTKKNEPFLASNNSIIDVRLRHWLLPNPPNTNVEQKTHSPQRQLAQDQKGAYATVLSTARQFPRIYSCTPAFHPNGETYAHGMHNGSIEVNQENYSKHEYPITENKSLTSIAFSNDGTHLAGADQDGKIAIFKQLPPPKITVLQTIFLFFTERKKQKKEIVTITADNLHHQWFNTLPEYAQDDIAPSINIRKQ